MNRRRCHLSLLSLSVALITAAAAPAQHVDIQPERQRLSRFKQEIVLEQQNTQLRAQLLKALWPLLQDPALWGKIPALLKDPLSALHDPEIMNKLQGALNREQMGLPPDHPLFEQMRKALENGAVPPPMDASQLPSVTHAPDPHRLMRTQRELQQFLKKKLAAAHPAAPGHGHLPRLPLDRPIESSTPAPGRSDADSSGFDAEEWFEDWLVEQIKQLELNEGSVSSAALQDMLRELHRFEPTESWNPMPRSQAFKGVSRHILDYARQLNLGRFITPPRLPNLRQLAPAGRWSLPKVRLPSLNWMPSMPSLGPRSTGPEQRSGFATLILAVSAATLLCIYLARYFQARSGVGLNGVSSAWPVAPSRVSNRDELIRAFEYLSLRQLGREARTLHHRALAEGLGGQQPARRSAAQQLADLYELARYAPGSEPLSTEALQSARRSLILLSRTHA